MVTPLPAALDCSGDDVSNSSETAFSAQSRKYATGRRFSAAVDLRAGVIISAENSPATALLEQDEVRYGQFCFSCGEAIHAEGREGRWGSIGRAGRQSGRPPQGNPARWFAFSKPTNSQTLPVDLVPF